MARRYDLIAFNVTGMAAPSPIDGRPAVMGRVFYDAGESAGIQFQDDLARTWDVLFADLPWYDHEHGVGGRLRLAVQLLRLALRILASRFPGAPDLIIPFTPPTPVPGPAPSDTALLPAYLNTEVRPYIGAVVQETERSVNAAQAIINALLRLIREPNGQ